MCSSCRVVCVDAMHTGHRGSSRGTGMYGRMYGRGKRHEMVHGRSRFSRALRSPLYLFSINVSFLLVFFSRQRAQPLYSMGPIHACVQGGACAVWRVTVRLRDRVSQGHAARQNPKKKIWGQKCAQKARGRRAPAAARRRPSASPPPSHPTHPSTSTPHSNAYSYSTVSALFTSPPPPPPALPPPPPPPRPPAAARCP